MSLCDLCISALALNVPQVVLAQTLVLTCLCWHQEMKKTPTKEEQSKEKRPSDPPAKKEEHKGTEKKDLKAKP